MSERKPPHLNLEAFCLERVGLSDDGDMALDFRARRTDDGPVYTVHLSACEWAIWDLVKQYAKAANARLDRATYRHSQGQGRLADGWAIMSTHEKEPAE